MIVDRLRSWLFGGEQASSAPSGARPPYSAAQVNPTNHMWMPRNVSGDTALRDSWEMMNGRVRDSVRNDPALRKVKAQLVRLLIGPGIQTFASAEDGAGNEIDDYNQESDQWFTRWCEDEADAEGEQTHWDMQQLSADEMIEVGNSLILRVASRARGRSVPLCYQLVEWEQLARTYDRERDVRRSGIRNAIRNGIEYNSRNQKVAYYLYDQNPYDDSIAVSADNVTRIPASRIIHNYLKPRPSAGSGASWFATILLPSRDIDWYLGNELTSAAEAALLVMIHKSNNHNGTPFGDNSCRNDPAKWGHATVAQVGLNDDVSIAESNRPNNNAASFIDLMNVRMSQGSLLSVNRFLGDPSRANMASIKASHQDDFSMIEPIQRHQGRLIAAQIRREWNAAAVANGVITTVSPDQYVRQRYRFDALDMGYPGTGEVQTEKEAPAAIDRMRSGLTTLITEVPRIGGGHWKNNIREMARVNKYAEKYEVVLDWTKGQGTVPDSATSIAKDEETESNETQ